MIRIKGGRILDPGNIAGFKDIVIKDQLIHSIIEPEEKDPISDIQIIDATGMIVVPGLIDIHVHLREPGQEHKETIETGLKAAAKGGFTAVCSMPNTTPVNDNSEITKFIIDKGVKANSAKVYPTGAITSGSLGEQLASINKMKTAGVVAVTDDGSPVENSNMMRQAMEVCKELDMPIFVHAEDKATAGDGAMNEGISSKQLGIKGIPNISESIMVVRDIELSNLTGAAVHFCHISTKESIDAIRQAKKRGVKVTCETAPHYFTLTDTDIKEPNANFKMNPPLRSEADKQAVIDGLIDGTIDLIASDHAPHSVDEKKLPFEKAPFGIVGLETSLALSLNLVHKNHLTMDELVQKMSKTPADIIGVNNDLKAGNQADITIIDPDAKYKISPDTFMSKSRNTPFSGKSVRGRSVVTIVDGKIIYQRH